MPLPVSLAEIAGDLQMLDDLSTAYLNRATGETRIVSEDDLAFADDDDPDLPDWQREAGRRAREALASDDWLALPSQFEIHPYRIMEAFCRSVPPAEGGEALARAIRGRGAFRRFRDTVERLGRIDAWYAHEQEAYERVAARWLADHDIPFDPASEA